MCGVIVLLPRTVCLERFWYARLQNSIDQLVGLDVGDPHCDCGRASGGLRLYGQALTFYYPLSGLLWPSSELETDNRFYLDARGV